MAIVRQRETYVGYDQENIVPAKGPFASYFEADKDAKADDECGED